MSLKIYITAILLAYVSIALGEVKREHFSEVNVTSAILSNGMRVLLKPLTVDSDEVVIRLTALGGYASLPPNQIAAGALASEVAAESGIGDMTANRFSVYLDRNFIEFNTEILPFSRIIEGNGDTTQVSALLKIIQSFFNEQHFTKTSFDAVLKEYKEKISENLSRDRQNPEAAYYNMNTEGYPYFQPLTLQDVEKIDFQTMHDFFYAAFSKPADFICVVTGQFEVKSMLEKLEETIGKITSKEISRNFTPLYYPNFPKGTTVRHYPGRGKGDSLARLTIPLVKPFKVEDFSVLQAVVPLVKAHLKPRLEEKYGSRLAVNISYDYPLEPLADSVWLVIFFHGPTKDIVAINDYVISEINSLITKGPLLEELHKAWEKITHTYAHSAKENSYWSNMLTEFTLRGWDIRYISRIDASHITVEKMKEVLKDYLPSNNYTLIYTQ